MALPSDASPLSFSEILSAGILLTKRRKVVRRSSVAPPEPEAPERRRQRCRPCFEKGEDHAVFPRERLLVSSYVYAEAPADAELFASVDPRRPSRSEARASEIRETLPATVRALVTDPEGPPLGENAEKLDCGPWEISIDVTLVSGLREISFAPVKRPTVQETMSPWGVCGCCEAHCPRSDSCRASGSASLFGDTVKNISALTQKNNLEALRLAYCHRLSVAAVRTVLHSLKDSLRHLDVAGCAQLGDDLWLGSSGTILETQLQWLSLEGCSQLTVRGLTAVLRASPFLRTLHLSGCVRLSDAAIRVALDSCPDLVDLELAGLAGVTGACFAEISTTTKAEVALVKVRKSLERLDLGDCLQVARPVLRWIARSMPSLTDLRVANVLSVDDEGLRALVLAPTVALRCLDVSGCTRLGADGGEAFMLLVRYQRQHLRHLDVRRLTALTAPVVKAFFDSLHLESLRLDRSLGLEDAAFGGDLCVAAALDDAEEALSSEPANLSDETSRMSFRALSRRRDSSVLRRRHSSAIMSLRRSRGESIVPQQRRDSSLLSKQRPEPPRFRNIKKRGSSIGSRRRSSSRLVFTSLEVLTASECPNLSAGGLVVAIAKTPRLRVLDLNNAAGGGAITDASMLFIARHCPQLQVLKIARPAPTKAMSRHVLSRAFLTDASLFHLGTHLPYLEELDLSHHLYLIGVALECRKGAWPLLRTLKIFGCKAITPRGLRFIINAAPNLRRLDYRNAEATSSSVIPPSESLKREHFERCVADQPYVAAYAGGFLPVPGAGACERRDEIWARFWQEDAAATVLACAYRLLCVENRITRRKAKKVILRAHRHFRDLRKNLFYRQARLLVAYHRFLTRLAANRLQRWLRARIKRRRNEAASRIQSLYRRIRMQWLDSFFGLINAAATLLQAKWRSNSARIHHSLDFKRIAKTWQHHVKDIDALADALGDVRARNATSRVKRKVQDLKAPRLPSGKKRKRVVKDAPLSLAMSRKRRIAVYSEKDKAAPQEAKKGSVHVFGGDGLWPSSDFSRVCESRADFDPTGAALEREEKERELQRKDRALAEGRGYESRMPWRECREAGLLLAPLARARLIEARRGALLDKATAIAEAKKLEEAKRLEKALEKEAEENQRRSEAAAAASQARHDAASKMAALCRGRFLRRSAKQRKDLRRESRVIEKKTRKDRAVRSIQRVARGRSTRNYVSENAIFTELAKPGEGLEVRKAKLTSARRLLALRVDRDLKLRRSYERLSAIVERRKLMAECEATFEKTRDKCRARWVPLDEAYDRFKSVAAANDAVSEALRAELEGDAGTSMKRDEEEDKRATFTRKRRSTRTINSEVEEQLRRRRMTRSFSSLQLLAGKSDEEEEGQAPIKQDLSRSRLRDIKVALSGASVRRHHLKYAMEAVEASRWWAVEAARCSYRRHRARELMSRQAEERFAWIAEEAERVSRLRDFVKGRRAVVPETIENRFLVQWLEDQASKLVEQSVAFDQEQEHLLAREAELMRKVLDVEKRTMGLTDELVHVLFDQDITFDAEKVGLEIARFSEDPESKEALGHLQAATELKAKQELLHSGVQLRLRSKLEAVYDGETADLERFVSFEGDERGLAREKLKLIKANLAKPPKGPKKLFDVEKWMDVYRSQPWLAQQDLEESRRREARDLKKIKEATLKGTLDQKRKELESEREKLKALEADFEAKNAVIADLSSTRDEKRLAEAFLVANRPRLERLREDYKRRFEALEKLEAKVTEFSAALEREEREANERMERVDAAKSAFERREGDAEEKQSARNEARMREIFVELRSLDQQLAGLTSTVDETTLRTALLKRKGDLEEELKRIEGEEQKTRDRAERRKMLAKAAEEEAKAAEALKRKKELQAKLRLEKKEEAAQKKRALVEKKQQEQETKRALAKIEAENRAMERAKGVLQDMGLEDPTERRARPLQQKLKETIRKTLTGHESKEAEDHERNQMLQSLQRRQKLKVGAVRGLRSIRFTVGAEETETFSDRQNTFRSRSLPHYIRLKKTIGLQSQVVVWLEETQNQDDFITDIDLGSADENRSAKWLCFSHNSLNVSDTESFAIYAKKKPSSIYAVSSLQLSYTTQDENFLVENGYVKIDKCLSTFGPTLFGDIYFWKKTINRNVEAKLENEETLLKDLKQVQKILKVQPNDRSASERRENIQKRLQKVREDQAYRDQHKNDPLKYAIEFLALTQPELEQWMDYFEAMDHDKDGFVTSSEILEFLRLKETLFAKHVFDLLSKPDDKGRLDFGETVKCLGSFCFFAERELLHFAFSLFDTDESGTLTHDEFLALLADIHPENNRGQTTRALKEMALSATGKFTFDQFKDIHYKFPGVLSPAFRFQHAIRSHFFGDRFWDKKLCKYMETNKALKRDRANNADTLQADYMQRAKQQARRESLLSAKRDEAQKTQSIFKRTFLSAQIQALQFFAHKLNDDATTFSGGSSKQSGGRLLN